MNNSELVEQLMVQVKQNNALEDSIAAHIKNMDTLCTGLEDLNESINHDAIDAYIMLIRASIHILKLLLGKESNIIIDEESMQ